MEIRRYRKEDDIRTLIGRAVENVEPEHYSEEQQEHLEEVILEMNLEFSEKDRYEYFVAEMNEDIRGVAGFQRESGKVAGIFVDSEYANSGIGSRLMEKIEQKAREEGLKEMEALASLEAVDFYRKNGYNIIEEGKQDIEGEKIGIKVMKKELN